MKRIKLMISFAVIAGLSMFALWGCPKKPEISAVPAVQAPAQETPKPETAAPKAEPVPEHKAATEEAIKENR